MAELNTVVVRLIADIKQYEAGLAKAAESTKAFGDAGVSANARFHKAVSRTATGIIALGAGVAYESAKMATSFQQSTMQLVLHAGEAKKNLDLIRNGILNMAGSVSQTPIEISKGLYYIESAGYHGAAALQVVKAAAQGASTAGADMVTVSNALTTAMRDYSMPANKAATAMSALVTTTALGKTNLNDLAGSMSRVLPIAAALHIPLAQIYADMATMTVGGTKANMASRWLARGLISLTAPSKQQLKVLGAVGISVQQLTNWISNPRQGLVYAYQQIRDHVKGATNSTSEYNMAIKDIMGSTQSMDAYMLLSGKHAKMVSNDYQLIGKTLSTNTQTVKDFGLSQTTLAQKLSSLKASSQAILIRVGDALLPDATKVANWALGVINFFKNHPLVSKIASDAAMATFAAAVVYKLASGVKAVIGLFNKGAQVELLTVIARNTGIMAGEGGAAGTAGGASGKFGTFGNAVLVFSAGVAAFELTSKALQTSFGHRVGNILTAGGSFNPINDIAATWAQMFGGGAHPTTSLAPGYRVHNGKIQHYGATRPGGQQHWTVIANVKPR